MNNQPDSRDEGSSYLRYDRSERLKRAPEVVQQMYEPDYIKKMSLLKSLTATRSTRSMLFAIVAVFALTFASFLFKTDRQSGKIEGVPVKLEYLTQQEHLYVNISFAAAAYRPYHCGEPRYGTEGNKSRRSDLHRQYFKRTDSVSCPYV